MTSPSAALSEHVQTSRRVTALGERVLRFEEYDSAGAPTGRGATFVGVEFHGLKYADLIDHKLNTPINIPLRWTNARVVESDLEGVSPEDVASVNTSLESPYSSRTIGLVQDGWLPSGMALQDNMVVMPDRCTFSELSGRFRDGAKRTKTIEISSTCLQITPFASTRCSLPLKEAFEAIHLLRLSSNSLILPAP